MKVLKTFGESSDHFELFDGMKILKIFRESSGCFRSCDWYEYPKDFWRIE